MKQTLSAVQPVVTRQQSIKLDLRSLRRWGIKEAFTLNHFGYATAIGIVMSVLILVISVFNLRVLRKREVEY